MNYEKNYKDLIRHAKNRQNDTDKTLELHHIIPRSLGGDDNLDNLVLLTPREHYLAHYLLYKFSTGEDKEKMATAFLFMSNIKKEYIFSSRLYEELSEKNKKKVICLQTLKVFSSITSAAIWLAEETNNGFITTSKNLSAHLNNKRRSCYEYTFSLYDENKKYKKEEKCKNKNFSDSKKKVICLQTLKVFNSARDASDEMKIPYKNISRSCINGMSTYGYTFSFYDENKKYKKEEKKQMHKQEIKKVLCIETGEIFNNLSDAERKTKIIRSTLTNAIKNDKAINGLNFKFI